MLAEGDPAGSVMVGIGLEPRLKRPRLGVLLTRSYEAAYSPGAWSTRT